MVRELIRHVRTGIRSYGLAVLLFVLLLLFAPLFPVKSPDAWKHMVDGNYVSTFHGMAHYSTFTVAPVRDVIPGDAFDWLGSVLIHELYRLGGYPGLQFFKLVVPATMVGLLYTVHGSRFNLNWFASSLLVVYVLAEKFYARAAAFGPVLLGIELFLLWKYRCTRDNKFLWYVLPVLAVWGNLHGSYLLGTYLFVLGLVGFFLDRAIGSGPPLEWSHGLRTLILIVLAFLVVVYVKPFPNDESVGRLTSLATSVPQIIDAAGSSTTDAVGKASQLRWRTLERFTHDLAVRDRPLISDEFSFTLEDLSEPDLWIPVLILPGLYLFVIFATGGVSFSTVIPGLFVFWLGISVKRVAPLAGVTLYVFALTEWKQGGSNSFRSLVEPGWFHRRFYLMVTSLVLLAVTLVQYGHNAGEYTLGRSTFVNPDLPRYILDHHPDRPTFTLGTPVGSYALWLWWPRKRVFFQSKNKVYRHDFIRALTKQHSTPTRAWRTLETFDFNFALISREIYRGGNNMFSVRPGWELVGSSKPYQTMYLYCLQCRVRPPGILDFPGEDRSS